MKWLWWNDCDEMIAAVKSRNLKEWCDEMIVFSEDAFREVPPKSACLIKFNVCSMSWLTSDRFIGFHHMKSARPTYSSHRVSLAWRMCMCACVHIQVFSDVYVCACAWWKLVCACVSPQLASPRLTSPKIATSFNYMHMHGCIWVHTCMASEFTWMHGRVRLYTKPWMCTWVAGKHEKTWNEQKQARIPWGIHGLPKVSLGPTISYHSTPCRRPPLKRLWGRFRPSGWAAYHLWKKTWILFNWVWLLFPSPDPKNKVIFRI
jgi:hypothetical protein